MGIGLTCLGCVMVQAVTMPSRALAQRACHVATVVMSPPDAQVEVGQTFSFFGTAFDVANNVCVPVTDFTWSSSNLRVATIDRYGIATGVRPGVTIITARFGTGRHAKASQATLQVVGVVRSPDGSSLRFARPRGVGCAAWDRQPRGSGRAEGLLVSPLRVVLVRGESFPLDYRAVRGDGGNAGPVCILFSVYPRGERIARVDSVGVIHAGGNVGHALVRLVVPANPAWLPRQISVVVSADGVRFAEHEPSMALGATDTLTMVIPAQGNRSLDPVGLFQFVSSDTSVVKVSPIAPVIRAVGIGAARITAVSKIYPDLVVTVVVRR